MRQSDIFMEGEADRWLERNRAGVGTHDPVMNIIQSLDIRPENALEIGCSNGWRLKALRDKYGCRVMGVEPGQQAAEEAGKLKVPVFSCTAAAMPILSRTHDVVIYGFCLYLADPVDWFKIIAEGDRVLKDGGYLIVHDFAIEEPFGRTYEHCDGVTSYHVDFAGFWLASPLYELVQRDVLIDGDDMVTVLRKLPMESIEVLP